MPVSHWVLRRPGRETGLKDAGRICDLVRLKLIRRVLPPADTSGT